MRSRKRQSIHPAEFLICAGGCLSWGRLQRTRKCGHVLIVASIEWKPRVKWRSIETIGAQGKARQQRAGIENARNTMHGKDFRTTVHRVPGSSAAWKAEKKISACWAEMLNSYIRARGRSRLVHRLG